MSDITKSLKQIRDYGGPADAFCAAIEKIYALEDTNQKLIDALANIKHGSGVSSTAYQIASKALQEQGND
jgi:hypothetical protein